MVKVSMGQEARKGSGAKGRPTYGRDLDGLEWLEG
jgi:hypothetical protein